MLESNDLILTQIHDASEPVLKKVKDTYIQSFPPSERRDFNLFLNFLTDDNSFKVFVCYKNGIYAGFISCWQFESFVYVEHFAIDPSMRNGGIGGCFFKSFLNYIPSPIVLEVELPEDDLSRRRVSFYKRLGLVLDDHSYLQPPYNTGDDWLPLRLMSFGDINLSTSYDYVRDTIYKFAYRVNP